MKNFNFIIVFVVFFCFGGLMAFGQENNIQVFEKDGWGFSIQGDMYLQKVKLHNYPLLAVKFQHYDYVNEGEFGQYSIGASALYTWHPFKNDCPKLFLRFGLGGEFSRSGKNDTFLFNTQIKLGYTIKIKNVGIDIFTGPTGRFAPYKRSYEGDFFVYIPAPILYGKMSMYTGGVSWSFGCGFNYKHVGLFVAYNQPLTKFEHFSYDINDEYGRYVESIGDEAMCKYLTVGLTYKF